MKKIIISLFLVCILFFMLSCEHGLNVSKNTNNINTTDIITLQVNNKSRVEIINEPICDSDYYIEFNQTNQTNIVLKSTKIPNSPQEYMFKDIANISSPIKDDDTLSATSVCVNGDYAYVSYHYNEPDTSNISSKLFKGVIEVIDISEPTQPIIISSAYCDDVDFNTLVFDGVSTSGQNKLWIGGTDYNIGGAVYSINLSEGKFFDNSMIRYKVDNSNSVNGVACNSNYLYVSAGRSKGGSYVFDLPNMNINKIDTFTNAKSVISTDDKYIVLVSGNNASIRIYNQDEFNLIKTFPIGIIQPETGKSGLFIKDDLIWVAMGYNGVKAYNFNGELIHTLTLTNSNAFSTDITIDDDYIYVANGEDGMYICEAIQGVQEINVLDIYNYHKSTNNISVGESLIFIANGKDGFKILQRVPKSDDGVICEYNEFGYPDCIEGDIFNLCDNIQKDINYILPEMKNVKKSHPEYFDNLPTLTLKEDATVYFSFVNEGASKKNSFGAYTYNTSPSTVNDLDNKFIIFPNASKYGSGGKLKVGETMKYFNNLPSGTTIGTFLVFSGWLDTDNMSGIMTDGYYTHYTDNILNQNGYQQSLIFYDNNCEAILICFEDIRINGGDKDYNDCIVRLVVEPANAIDVTQFIQIGE